MAGDRDRSDPASKRCGSSTPTKARSTCTPSGRRPGSAAVCSGRLHDRYERAVPQGRLQALAPAEDPHGEDGIVPVLFGGAAGLLRARQGRALAEVEYGGKTFEDYIKPGNRTLAGELIDGMERYLNETEALVRDARFLAAVAQESGSRPESTPRPHRASISAPLGTLRRTP